MWRTMNLTSILALCAHRIAILCFPLRDFDQWKMWLPVWNRCTFHHGTIAAKARAKTFPNRNEIGHLSTVVFMADTRQHRSTGAKQISLLTKRMARFFWEKEFPNWASHRVWWRGLWSSSSLYFGWPSQPPHTDVIVARRATNTQFNGGRGARFLTIWQWVNDR